MDDKDSKFTNTTNFIRKLKQHIPMLVELNMLSGKKEPDKFLDINNLEYLEYRQALAKQKKARKKYLEKEFNKNILGISGYSQWYVKDVQGIRNCYKTILTLLNQIKDLREKNKKLEEELNKPLK